LFNVMGQDISGRDLILILGGLFLIAKATYEIHDKLEGEDGHASGRVAASFASVIGQVMLLDIVFSLDSVITAVGMADDLIVMVLAVIIAVGIMLLSAGSISTFVNRHPTVKVLALSFLLLIGVSLIAEGFDTHIPKGYIYFAMAFSVFVDTGRRKRKGAGKLHQPILNLVLTDRPFDPRSRSRPDLGAPPPGRGRWTSAAEECRHPDGHDPIGGAASPQTRPLGLRPAPEDITCALDDQRRCACSRRR
jgi:hypothetical protein